MGSGIGLTETQLAFFTRASQKHLRLLHAVDTFPGDGGLYSGPALDNALWRYEHCWLPLLADVLANNPRAAAKLVAPLDVAWVWHLHRLDSVAFHEDCQRLYGRLLSLPDELQMFRFSDGVDAQSAATRDLWRKLNRNEPFFDPRDRQTRDPLSSKLQCDLAAAAPRQVQFLRKAMQLNLTHNEKNLRRAIEGYIRFLQLKKLRPKLLPPAATYDVDFIWHTHSSMSAMHAADCQAIVGSLVGHDSALDDRNCDELLSNASDSTLAAWSSINPSRDRRAAPDSRTHIAVKLFELEGFLPRRDDVFRNPSDKFGPDFLSGRGGGLCLIVLNQQGAFERFKNNGASSLLPLPHSSKDAYWRTGFGFLGTPRNVNDLGAKTYLLCKKYLKFLPESSGSRLKVLKALEDGKKAQKNGEKAQHAVEMTKTGVEMSTTGMNVGMNVGLNIARLVLLG